MSDADSLLHLTATLGTTGMIGMIGLGAYWAAYEMVKKPQTNQEEEDQKRNGRFTVSMTTAVLSIACFGGSFVTATKVCGSPTSAAIVAACHPNDDRAFPSPTIAPKR